MYETTITEVENTFEPRGLKKLKIKYLQLKKKKGKVSRQTFSRIEEWEEKLYRKKD